MERKEQSDVKSVAYQNKDISSKFMAEKFRDTFFKVYGLDIPDIVRVEPTELPAIEVNDMSMDNLFYLKDGSYAIVDYESEYSEENKVKYLGYVARVLKRVYNQTKSIPRLRVVIIYTADVVKGSTNSTLDMGDEQLILTEAFLSEMDAAKIIKHTEEKLSSGIGFTDEEKLQLMLCPLSIKGKLGKMDAVRKAIELAKQIQDASVQTQVLSGLVAFCDKVLSQEDVEEIREIIKMTKFDRLIYEEKMEAVNAKAKEVTEEVTEKVTEEVTEKVSKEVAETIAANLLTNGLSVDFVSKNTKLDITVVEKIAEGLKAANKVEENEKTEEPKELQEVLAV